MVVRISFVRFALVCSFVASALAPYAFVYAYDLPVQSQAIREEQRPLLALAQLAGAGIRPPLQIPFAQNLVLEDIGPDENLIGQLYPGEGRCPVPHCGISYTLCKYGKDSWDYMREMQLRDAIEQTLLDLENAQNAVPVDELFISVLEAQVTDLHEQLEIVLKGRPRPAEGDPCLMEYRACVRADFNLGWPG